MLKIELVMEDFRLIAERDTKTVGKWELLVTDGLSKSVAADSIGDLELMAIAGLAIAGDNDDGEAEMTMEAMRHIAEPIVGKWPPECRPYP